MGIVIGFVVILGCVLGGYMAMGGHLAVLMQPWELIIIGGAGVGAFLIANPVATVKDSGKAIMEAFRHQVPTEEDYLETLGVLHSLMRELRSRSRSEVEAHIDNPEESVIFQAFPRVLGDPDLTNFICDYCRLIIIGNARPFEIEALMDEEIRTIRHDKLKSYHALSVLADAFPALGICAAVLGIIKAMGAIDQAPEILGGLVGAALVGTFLGIFLNYAVVGPIAQKVKTVRDSRNRLYVIVKQTLLAYMNGSLPQVALEFGRKTISTYERPTIDAVEEKSMVVHGGDERRAA